MLKDKKAAAFTENFAGQWLNLRKDRRHVATIPLFTPRVRTTCSRSAMVKEALLFSTRYWSTNLSLTNFVSSDFTLLNGRLARHYGIPGVTGQEFQRCRSRRTATAAAC